MAAVDAGTVAAAQRIWFALLVVVDAGMRERERFGQRGRGDPGCQIGGGVSGMAAGAHVALRLGKHMVSAPPRARLGHNRYDRFGGLCDPFFIDGFGALARCDAESGEHRGQAAVPENFDGLAAPGGALFGQRARFVLGFAGLQGGLLAQGEQLHGSGFAAVLSLKFLGQFSRAGLDRHPS
ncbi:Uncharacterised protein [Mycobacteroides abscessus subsp. abscessus]|nr:Uncharacterised protein [Mycobacteroides abscessus subsp. abscessus]